MGANGDAGYLASNSAHEFLVDTVAAIRDNPPRIGAVHLEQVVAVSTGLGQTWRTSSSTRPARFGASASSAPTRSLAAEQGHFDS